MANINLRRVGQLSIVQSFKQLTFGVSDPLVSGQCAMIDTVKGTPKVATSATVLGARVFGIVAPNKYSTGGVTLIKEGILDGYDLSTLAFDAPVYLGTDGNLSDTAGANSVVIGRVVSGFASSNGPNKLLWVEVR